MHRLTRFQPALPVQSMKTYQAKTPLATHFRKATCAEYQCDGYVNGWKSVIDETSQLGMDQADYIRTKSGRRCVETKNTSGMTTFTFLAGQSCFRVHQMPLERPGIFIVRSGDWRGGNVERVHSNADDWVDDFRNHTDRIATIVGRG